MLNEDINTLTALFRTHWQSDLPVVYDLMPQANYPEGSVHFSVVLGASKHLYGTPTAGGKLQQGRVWLDIEVQDQFGDGLAFDLIEQFVGIFRNWTDNIIVCRTEEVQGPAQIDKGMARFRVSVPFESVRPYPA